MRVRKFNARRATQSADAIKKGQGNSGKKSPRGAVGSKRKRPPATDTASSSKQAIDRSASSKAGEAQSKKVSSRKPAKKSHNIEAKAPSLASAPKRRSTIAQVEHHDLPEQQKTATEGKKDVIKANSESEAPVVELDKNDEDYFDSGDLDRTDNSDDVGMLGIGSPVFPPATQLAFDDQYEDTTDPINELDPWDESISVETRIRELQERLDGLMAGVPTDDLELGHAPASDRLTPDPGDSAVDSAREVLESEYYRRNWGRGAIRERTFDVDDFGLDPEFEQRVRPVVDFLFKRYFRVEVEGIRNVPETGRAVIVSNHSGALPWDGVMLREAIRTRHRTRNDLRWLAEDFSFYLPFLGVAINRMGAVRACQENASRLLEREHLVGVFPEGAEGTKKLFRHRYRLQRFGRGGFVRLCLQTQSPIIPCAIVGAEETNPILHRFDNLSKVLGLDYLPVTPTFPLLGLFGLIPAPTKWRIIFGEPISVQEYGPQAAQDHVLVGRLAEQVRTTISNMLETALRRRKSVWLG